MTTLNKCIEHFQRPRKKGHPQVTAPPKAHPNTAPIPSHGAAVDARQCSQFSILATSRLQGVCGLFDIMERGITCRAVTKLLAFSVFPSTRVLMQSIDDPYGGMHTVAWGIADTRQAAITMNVMSALKRSVSIDCCCNGICPDG